MIQILCMIVHGLIVYHPLPSKNIETVRSPRRGDLLCITRDELQNLYYALL